MPSAYDPLPARRIEYTDKTSDFSCGELELDVYLARHAVQAQNSGGPVTYVIVGDDGQVIAYYSLVNDSLSYDRAPERLSRGMGRYSVPMTTLTKLAVDETHKREGLGLGLIAHAFRTAVTAAEQVGSRGILVQPLNEALYGFYEMGGFKRIEQTPEPNLMYVLMKDVRAALRDAG